MKYFWLILLVGTASAQHCRSHPHLGAGARVLDVNPLFTDPTGVVAFDARLRVAPKETRGAARAAIPRIPPTSSPSSGCVCQACRFTQEHSDGAAVRRGHPYFIGSVHDWA